MPPFHETIPEAYSPPRPELKVSDAGLEITLSTAADVRRVAEGMTKDAEAQVIALGSSELRTADYLCTNLSNELRTARLLERGTMTLPVTDLEVIVGGAKSVREGYAERARRHLEEKAIPETPKTFTERVKKVGAEAVATCMVAAGNMSRTGRSARRLERKFDESALEEISVKSKAQKKKRKRSSSSSLNEWHIRLNGDEPKSKANDTTVNWL